MNLRTHKIRYWLHSPEKTKDPISFAQKVNEICAGPRKAGRGRPPKKGNAIKLKELFHDRNEQLQKATLPMYSKTENVRYYCVNLLWGQKLYQELRFVLVEYTGIQSILVSTNLCLEPVSIIRLYSYRFKMSVHFVS